MGSINRKGITRKEFIKIISFSFLSINLPIAIFSCSRKGSSILIPQTGEVTVYKLVAKDTADSACKKHAANKLFMSSEIADKNRAHVGCKCTIEGLTISPELYDKYFKDSSSGVLKERDSYDYRWEV